MIEYSVDKLAFTNNNKIEAKKMKISCRISLLKTVIIAINTLIAQSYAQESANNSIPDAKAVVIAGNARFTVLTPELIRMEWSSGGHFMDSPSLVFINRRLPVPPYKVEKQDSTLVITTDRLSLRYKMGSGEFAGNNLQVSFELNGKHIVWHPGNQDTSNLHGTIRTLDGVKGSIALDDGLLSRSGWALIDDTHRPLFDDSSWPWVLSRPAYDEQDWYFFGYGHDYVNELRDYVKVAGKIPMPPRFAFGSWWSRYWSFTDVELKNLVKEFGIFSVPLDVLVVDMDWHQTFDVTGPKGTTDQAGQSKGWTGYTWDTTLFPNHQAFLNWCHEKGLKTVLNLHPASGIQPWEACYPAMANALEVDTSSHKYIPFELTDKRFAEDYFKLVLHPLEKEGVDFWWMDWQQWDTTNIANLNPTWWLNYAFYSDMAREHKGRPLILSRWGGLGDHRYQIGFSGDVVSDWSSLQFQPYFTATAANVGFSYWSHDIGGHLYGTVSPELYTRWVQFGAMSPILRTHTTKNPEAERRIWAFPLEYFMAMRKAFTLREKLLPYIYTASRNTYDSGISMIHPLYYDYPENDEAYKFGDEYFFGQDLIVAPVVNLISPDSLFATEKIWVPPGTWIDWYSGEKLQGPEIVEQHYTLSEIPILVRDGAVIPMQSIEQRADISNVDPLIFRIFPDSKGGTRCYEDEGNSQGYQNGEYAWVPVNYETENEHMLKVTIEPENGTYPGMGEDRSYVVELMNVFPPTKVICNSRELSQLPDGIGWRYDGSKLETIVTLPSFDVHEKVELTLEFGRTINSNQLYGLRGKMSRMVEAMEMLKHLWQNGCPEIMVDAAQCGDRMTLYPNNAENEIDRFNLEIPKIRETLDNLPGDKNVIRLVKSHLSDVLPK